VAAVALGRWEAKTCGVGHLQLASAGRYSGGVAITLRDLPFDERVATLRSIATPIAALRDRSFTIAIG
jgi:hypothetical protein